MAATSVLKSHSDYTVGWICALPKEQTAAILVLDTRHHDLPKASTDTNAYTLGSIGPHNVVITCLPMNRYGTNQAARAATQMLSTFPCVKIGLMVGIGAGIPGRTNLGDVVISTEWTQWDLGKTKNGVFEHISKRYYPPEELCCAMSKLRAEHDLNGTKIQQHIDKLRSANRELPLKYTSVEGFEGAENLGPDSTEIHYGLVASGNQVVKDAQLRDDIDRRLGNDVLCIEMEAAGLVEFPAAIIRGICDYADERKDNHWQEYAAVVAAICARELLNCMQPRNINEMKAINGGSEKYVTTTSTVQRNLTKEETRKLLNRLPAAEFSSQQNACYKTRQKGTGQWFLNSPEYQTWLENKQILFCPGIPGAGKTILTSIVIDDLTDRYSHNASIGIAYIFFDFKGTAQLHLDDLLLSIFKQLATSLALLSDCVSQVCEEYQRFNRLSRKTIIEALYKAVGFYSRTFIIIDALDECRSDLGKLFEELFELRQSHYINIFATSRYIPEIQEIFSGNSVQLDIKPPDMDIRAYLEGQISLKGTRVLKKNKETIVTEILESAHGVFLLAKLHFEFIKDKLTLKEIKTALQSLISGERPYDSVYENIMERISEQNSTARSRDMAYQILSWITCAERRLDTRELQHAIAVWLDESEIRNINQEAGEYDFDFDFDDIPEVEDMISLCCGLVTVDEYGTTIKWVHHTALEYFERTKSFWFPWADDDIAKISIIYMAINFLKREPQQSFKEVTSGSPKEERPHTPHVGVLLGYATYYWDIHMERLLKQHPVHTVKSERGATWFTRMIEPLPLVVGFLRNFDLRRRWAAYRFPIRPSYLEMRDSISYWYHTYQRLSIIIGKLSVNGDKSPDTKSNEGTAPLEQVETPALDPEYERLGRVGRKASRFYKPEPSGAELLSVFKALARYGIYLGLENQIKKMWDWAVLNGEKEILEQLLSGMGATGRSLEQETKTRLLYMAINLGQTGILKLLVEGENLEGQDDRGRRLLPHAAAVGDKDIVKMLLTKGARIEGKDDRGRTALSHSAEHGHKEIVEMLIDAGADMESEDNSKQTPLSWAIVYQRHDVIKLFVERGINLHLSAPQLRYLVGTIGRGKVFSEKVYVALQNSHSVPELGFEPSLRNMGYGALEVMKSLLYLAAESRRVDFLDALLERGVPESDLAEAILTNIYIG
ncbi:hypothetical protein TWF718_007818 [Orbilia javanica]|uniref:Nucleoside phosphorylase domain-containing protein n=1 Tax=Orbilia javanica TaxID=47235 RepID=A0AAN8RBY1_9PEZI